MINILILLTICKAGHIFFWDSQVIYCTDGSPKAVRFLIALESGLPADRYIYINTPYGIPGYGGAYIYDYNPLDDNQTQVFMIGNLAILQQTLSIQSSDITYKPMKTQKPLIQNKWYILELQFSGSFDPTVSYIQQPFIMFTTSSTGTNRITYDSNSVIGNIYIQPVPVQVMTVTYNSQYNHSMMAINNITFSIDLRKDWEDEIIIFVEVVSGDFYFTGQCFSSIGNCSMVFGSTKLVQTIIEEVLFSTDRLSVSILVGNPAYQQSAVIRVSYFQSFNGVAFGQVQDFNQISGLLSTQAISINQKKNFKVYHGIEFQTLQNTSNNIFQQSVLFYSSQDNTVYNQIRFEFGVGDNFYPDSVTTLRLQVYIPGGVAIPYSYNYNFQYSSGNVITCGQQGDYIYCQGIQYFVKNKNYFIAFRAKFSSAPSSNIINFGKIQIQLIDQDITGAQVITPHTVYIESAGYNVAQNAFRKATYMVDTDGYEQVLGNVQVTSVNQVSNDLNDIYNNFYSPNTQAQLGIAPDSYYLSTLLFFIKQSIQTSGDTKANLGCSSTSSVSQTDNLGQLMVNILYNSAVISFKQNLAIDQIFVFSNTPSSIIRGQNGEVFYFTCGTIGATKISSNCEIFGGKATSDFFALQNILFSTYFTQYPLIASEYTLDFVISFTAIKSSTEFNTFAQTIITGYTISKQQEDFTPFLFQILNYQTSGSNLDSPTILRLSGYFPYSLIPYQYSGIAIFVDSSIQLSFNNEVDGYSCSTGKCQSHSVQSFSGCVGSALYYHNSMIKFDFLNLDSNFELLIPVTTSGVPPNFMHIAFLKGGVFLDLVTVYSLSGVLSTVGIDTQSTFKYSDQLKAYASQIKQKQKKQSDIDEQSVDCPKLMIDQDQYLKGSLQFTSNSSQFQIQIDQQSGLLITSTGVLLFQNQQENVYFYNLLQQYWQCSKFTSKVSTSQGTPRSKSIRSSLLCFVYNTDPSIFKSLKIQLNTHSQQLPAGQLNSESFLSYSIFVGGMSQYFVTFDQLIGDQQRCLIGESTQTLRQISLKDQQITIPIIFQYALPMDYTQSQGFRQLFVFFSFSNLPSDWLQNYLCGIKDASYLSCTAQADSSADIKLTIKLNQNSFLYLQQLKLVLFFVGSSTQQSVQRLTYTVQIITPNKQSDNQYWIYGDVSGDQQIFSSCGGTIQVMTKSTIQYAKLTNPSLNYDIGSYQTLSVLKFSIKFSQLYENQKVLYAGDLIAINWGFLAGKNSFVQNCQIYENNTINFEFQYLDLVKGFYSDQDIYNIDKRVFQVICDEIYSFHPSINANDFTISLKSSSQVLLSSITRVGQNDIILKEAPRSLFFDLIKNFNQIGQDSDYIFTIQLTSSQSITLYSRILVKFPQSFAFRLNRVDGSFTCFVQGIQGHCKLQSARKITIIVPSQINPINGQIQMTVKIAGISQPSTTSSTIFAQSSNDVTSNGIIVQIILNGIYSQGCDFQGNITSDSNSSPSVMSITVINATSKVQIRANSNHTIYALFPSGTLNKSGTISKNRIIFVDLWGLNSSLSLTNIQCSVVSENGKDITKQCEYVDCKRIQILVSHDRDNLNDPMVYSIKIRNILNPLTIFDEMVLPSPNYLCYSYLKYQILVVDDPNDIIIAQSSLYSPKSLINFNQIGFDLIKKDFMWRFYINYQGIASDNELPIGYISRQVRLYLRDYSYYDSPMKLIIKNNSDFLKSFTVYPQLLKASLNDPYISFVLGPKPSTLEGVYRYQTERLSNSDQYVDIPPPLQFIVIQKLCTLINPTLDSDIPLGGYSQPIILDFNPCYPSSGDLIITASIITQASSTTIAMQPIQQTISPIPDMSNAQVIFVVKVGTDTSLINQLIYISFTLSGQCQQYYAPIPQISAQIVDNSLFKQTPTATVTVQTITSSCYSQNITLSFSCDQIGQLYYVYSLSQQGISFSDIYSKLSYGQTQKLQQSPDDPFWTGYGYLLFNQPNIIQQVQLTNLKSNSTYQVRAFCVNLMNKTSSGVEVQAGPICDNQQRVIKATVYFYEKNPLTPLQQKQLACSFTSLLNINLNRVQNNNFYYCDFIMESLFYKEGLIQKQLKDTPFFRLLPSITDTTQSYVYYINPDYESINFTKYQTMRSLLYSRQFFGQLISNTLQPTTFPQSGFITISEATSLSYPILGVDVITIDQFQLNFTVSILNQNGYIYLGFDVLNPKKPTQAQIRVGLNGNNAPLYQFNRCYLQQKVEKTFIFDRISDDIKYNLYFTLSSDDVSSNALFDPKVYVHNFTLKQEYTLNNNEKLMILIFYLCLFII